MRLLTDGAAASRTAGGVLDDGARRLLLELHQQFIERPAFALHQAEQLAELFRIGGREFGHGIDDRQRKLFFVLGQIHVSDIDRGLLVLNRHFRTHLAVDQVTGALVDDDGLNHAERVQGIAHRAALRIAVDPPVQRIEFDAARVHFRVAHDPRTPMR